MRKLLAWALCLALALSLCAPALGEGEPIHLTSKSQRMYVGQTLQLFAAPQGLPLTYVSSKESVATVDANGQVTAHGRGAAVITVSSAEDAQNRATVKITVQTAPSQITLSAEKLVLALGQSESLRAKVEPSNADNKKLTWFSSDPEVATVNQNGRVTLHAPGSARITAASQADPTVFATLEIQEEQPAQQLAFQEKQVAVPVGGQVHLLNPSAQTHPVAEEALTSAYTLLPEDITDPSVSFKSSRPKIASVDENGVVTGLAPGKALVTATAQDGSKQQDTLVIQVTQPVTGLALKEAEVRIGVGHYNYLNASLAPKDATNEAITWVSSDPAVATVSGSGLRAKVTVLAWGECTVTAMTQEGGYSASAVIHGGSYDQAVTVTELGLADGQPILQLTNISNETVAQVRLRLRAYNGAHEGIAISANTRHPLELEALYEPDLAPGAQSLSDRFYFEEPAGVFESLARLEISRFEAAITGLTLENGLSHELPESRWQWVASR